MEQQALYSQFHLDEPWDSPHNNPLIALMPEVFQSPSAILPEGKTAFLAVVGKACVLDGSGQGIGFAKISDGTSKTIMLVEADADQAVEWTKPDDWEYDANAPTAGLGHLHPGGWLAAWADGHVSFVPNTTDQQVLKALFTRNGREVVQVP